LEHRLPIASRTKGLFGKINALSSGSLFGAYTFNKELDCGYYGACNACDVQCKYDKDGKWGFSAVTITADHVKISSYDETDWAIPELLNPGYVTNDE
jgi:hypothetical protein